MSIFKETFQPFVFNQLQIRKLLQASGSSNRFGKLNTLNFSGSGDSGDSVQKSIDLSHSPGVYFTNATKKQCTIRMSSGVDLKSNSDVLEGTEYEEGLTKENLAKNYILQGGVIPYSQGRGFNSFNLNRAGVREPKSANINREANPTTDVGEFEVDLGQVNAKDTLFSAYGDPHIRANAQDGYGIVPMPGIKDMTIRTTSAYGSLRVAKVSFHCHNRRQLEILELLYMRPGYPILIEWGWAPYITNEGDISNTIGFVPQSDFFDSDKDIKQLNDTIFKKKKDAGGNYDGFLGFCKNFEFKARGDGGYDCFTEIIASGEVLVGLKGKREGEQGITRYATTYEEFIYNRTGISRDTESYREDGIDYSDMQNQILFTEYNDAGELTTLIGPTYDALTDFYVNQIYNSTDTTELPQEQQGDPVAMKQFLRDRKGLYPVDTLELYLIALDDTPRRRTAFEKLKETDYKAKRNSSVEINQNDYDDLYLLIHHILKQQYSESDLNKEDVMDFIETSLLHDMNYRRKDMKDYDGADDILGANYTTGDGNEIKERDAEGNLITQEEQREGRKDNNVFHDYSSGARVNKEQFKGDGYNIPTNSYEGIRIEDVPATFIRWDFLVEIINYFVIPNIKKEKNRPRNPIVELTYLRDNVNNRNNKEYLSYSNFYLSDTALAEVNDTYANLGRALDKSIDPSIMFFPNQANIGDNTLPPFMGDEPSYGSSYNNHQDIYNGIYPLRGKNKKNQLNSIGYIYLNLKHLRDTYREMRYYDDDSLRQDFSLYKYLDQIWKDVNKACGDIHNFQIQTTHEESNKVRVIDLQYDDIGLSPNLYELDIEGKNSIVRDFNYTSTIPSALTSTIAIAAQAGEDIDNLEKVSFAAFNQKIKSRFSNQTISSEVLKQKIKDLLLSFKTNVNDLVDYYGQIESGLGWYNLKLGLDQPLIMKDNAYRILQQIQKEIININSRNLTTGKLKEGADIKMGKSAIIPIKFNAQLDGIGGIVIGNVFRVNPKHIPLSYKGRNIAFVVTSEQQKVTSGQDWTTEIGGQLILRDESPNSGNLSIKNPKASYTKAELDVVTEIEGNAPGSSGDDDDDTPLDTPNADFVRNYFKFLMTITPEDTRIDQSWYDTFSPFSDDSHFEVEDESTGEIVTGEDALGTIYDALTTENSAGSFMFSRPIGASHNLATQGINEFVQVTKRHFQESGNPNLNTGLKAGYLTKSNKYSPGRDITEKTAFTMIVLFTELLRRVPDCGFTITSGGRNPKKATHNTNHKAGHSFDFTFRPFDNNDETYQQKYLQIVQIITQFVWTNWDCAPSAAAKGYTGSVNDFRFLNEYQFQYYDSDGNGPFDRSVRSKIRKEFHGKWSNTGRGDHFHISTGDSANPGEGETARTNLYGKKCYGEGWDEQFPIFNKGMVPGFTIGTGTFSPFPAVIRMDKEMDFQELFFRLNEEYRPQDRLGSSWFGRNIIGQDLDASGVERTATILNTSIEANEVTCNDLEQLAKDNFKDELGDPYDPNNPPLILLG